MNLLSLVVTEVYRGTVRSPNELAIYHYLLDSHAVEAFDQFDCTIYDFLHTETDGKLWEDVLPNFCGYSGFIAYLLEHDMTIEAERSELAPEGVKTYL